MKSLFKLPLMTLALVVVAPSVSSAQEGELRSLHSQPCFTLSNKEVEVALTQIGAQMAPVTFFRDSPAPVSPYHVTPWQDEPPSKMPAPVLVALRGDFFCLPFGGNSEDVDGEKHPPHGEVVGSPWRFVGNKKVGDVTTLSVAIETKVRKGNVKRELSLVDGQNVIYSKSTIEGFAGSAPLGHHATLAMPEKEGSVRIATSAIRFGMTCPSLFSDPKQREYQSLLPGAKWSALKKVPVAWKGSPDADLTRLPARFGYADLVQVINKTRKKNEEPAWTAATFTEGGYVWFSLKDASVLNSTVLWIENHGRHGHPWNGRNSCLGLEDVTAFFADGLAASTHDNKLTKAGVQTAVTLSVEKPTEVYYIQGVVKVPAGFEQVKTLEFEPGKVTFISTTGVTASAPVRHEFLKTGKL